MATRVAIELDYCGTDPWAETKISFELHSYHGSPEVAHGWILERIRRGPLELFTLLAADGSEVLFCPDTVTAFATWEAPGPGRAPTRPSRS